MGISFLQSGLTLDNAARFFLGFSHDTIIIPILIIGYLWLDKKAFFHAICLILISILFNFALKITFQVPLSPTLGKEGFAFPSGHMQSSIVLYGWLFIETHIILVRLLILILLLSIGLSLLHFGYHNYLDILAAIFFGILLIFTYKLFLEKNKGKVLFIVIPVFATFLMLYAALIYEIKENVWMAYYALIGVMFSEYCFENKRIRADRKNKVMATGSCFLMLIIIRKIFGFVNLPIFLSQIQWLLLGFFVPCSSYVVNLVTFRRVPNDR